MARGTLHFTEWQCQAWAAAAWAAVAWAAVAWAAVAWAGHMPASVLSSTGLLGPRPRLSPRLSPGPPLTVYLKAGSVLCPGTPDLGTQVPDQRHLEALRVLGPAPNVHVQSSGWKGTESAPPEPWPPEASRADAQAHPGALPRASWAEGLGSSVARPGSQGGQEAPRMGTEGAGHRLHAPGRANDHRWGWEGGRASPWTAACAGVPATGRPLPMWPHKLAWPGDGARSWRGLLGQDTHPAVPSPMRGLWGGLALVLRSGPDRACIRTPRQGQDRAQATSTRAQQADGTWWV